MVGQGYNFRPMMPFYSRFMGAPSAWLESPDGRLSLARVIRFCRSRHGRAEARRFVDALVYVGVYPCWAGRF